jgi:eukaryotic-like serine/threonine-protein kinase
VTSDAGDVPAGIPAPGEVLSEKYQVERVLGMGGMGVVLAARHVALGQRVAIKLLRPEIAKLPEAAERFLREARASTSLKSQHVAHVLDVGALASGAPYMVLEYLEGRDLHDLARSGTPLPIASTVEYVLQAAEALAEAHGAGIVHRDLKPANLFLTSGSDGSALVKVLDFGISKATLPGERGLTQTDAVLGSPGYMAPEQIRSTKHVDQRADIWGLGVCLHELVTGRPPFDGESVAAVSVQIAMEPAPLLHTLRPDAPEGLSRVVERCLEKDPSKRYANMGELAGALLPFAPRGSEPAVERIRRIVRGSVAFDETINASAAALAQTISAGASAASAGTNGAWEASKPTAPRRRALTLGLAGAVAAVAALAGVYGLGQRSAATPTAATATRDEPPKAAASPVVEAPSVAAKAPPSEPAASPAASANAASPTPHDAPSPAAAKASARVRKPLPAPARPSCAKGQTLSNGHCCPAGLVWQKNACDRPLAVTLP